MMIGGLNGAAPDFNRVWRVRGFRNFLVKFFTCKKVCVNLV